MTKKDYIWVAIRVFGLYLWVCAVMAIPSLVSGAMIWHQAGQFAQVDANEPGFRAMQTLMRTGAVEFVSSAARLIVFTLIGAYLIRGGGWVFRILCPPDTDKPAV